MKDKDIVRNFKIAMQEYQAWLSEFPDIVHVLKTLEVRVDGNQSMNAGTACGMEYCTISGLREQVRRMRSNK